MRDATARAALKALQEGKKVKLEYESPWYWLVSISGAARPAEAPKPRERKTKIDLSGGESKASYDLSAQQDEEMAPPKLTRSVKQEPLEFDLNDPIVARAMSNSPQGAAALAALPKQLRHFDEEEDLIEEQDDE